MRKTVFAPGHIRGDISERMPPHDVTAMQGLLPPPGVSGQGDNIQIMSVLLGFSNVSPRKCWSGWRRCARCAHARCALQVRGLIARVYATFAMLMTARAMKLQAERACLRTARSASFTRGEVIKRRLEGCPLRFGPERNRRRGRIHVFWQTCNSVQPWVHHASVEARAHGNL